MKSWKDDPRSETNPLFNENKLKLGFFGMNSGEQVMSLAPDRYRADWDRTDHVTGEIDRLGLEAMVSLMGWLGTIEHEPFTWAAALAGRHAGPAVISTFHMPLMHPTFVAKAAATVDLVSKGRFGINVVAGFNTQTLASFSLPIMDHAQRYQHAEEYIDLLKRLWRSEDYFTFQGKFFNIARARSEPLPVQKLPPIMNAGMSGRGREFACKNADMVFTLLEPNKDDARAQIAEYRRIAREEYGRDIQIWTHGHIVIRETEKEAEDFLNYYAVEHADTARIAEWLKALGVGDPGATHNDPDKLKRLNSGWAAGAGTRLVGTAEQVAEELGQLSDIGLDGILWNTIEPENLLLSVEHGLLPRLEASGHRKPARATAP